MITPVKEIDQLFYKFKRQFFSACICYNNTPIHDYTENIFIKLLSD